MRKDWHWLFTRNQNLYWSPTYWSYFQLTMSFEPCSYSHKGLCQIGQDSLQMWYFAWEEYRTTFISSLYRNKFKDISLAYKIKPYKIKFNYSYACSYMKASVSLSHRKKLKDLSFAKGYTWIPKKPCKIKFKYCEWMQLYEREWKN